MDRAYKFFLAGLFLGLTCIASPQTRIQPDHTSLKSERVTIPQLVEILNYGSSREISHDPPLPEEELRLRLHAVPKEGNCVSDTHSVCSHRYYLAVSAFEDGLPAVVYDLGEVGEMSNIQWLKSERPQTVRLRVLVTNYPVEYFKLNSKLLRKEQAYELEVSLTRLTIKPSK